MSIFGEVIYSYSRAQAIEDGVLVDVSQITKEAGIRYPTAVTSAVWDMIVPNEAVKSRLHQDLKGRLWDVIHMARIEMVKAAGKSSEVSFSVYLPQDAKGAAVSAKNLHTFKVICGPGDDLSPVLTILLPDED